jgi:hypothetical protein
MTNKFEQSMLSAEQNYLNKQQAPVETHNRTNNMLNEVLGKINKFADKVSNLKHQATQGNDPIGAVAGFFDQKKKQEQDPNSLFANNNFQQSVVPGQNQQSTGQTQQNQQPGTRKPRGNAATQWQQYLKPSWDKMPPEMKKQFGDDFNSFVQYKMQEANFRRQGHKL